MPNDDIATPDEPKLNDNDTDTDSQEEPDPNDTDSQEEPDPNDTDSQEEPDPNDTDSQEEPEPQEEPDPIFSIHGEVTHTGNPIYSMEDVRQVFLLWSETVEGTFSVAGEAVDVTGDAPAPFHIELMAPPDEGLLFTLEPRIAVAQICATVEGTDLKNLDTWIFAGCVYGYRLLYIENDVQPGSPFAEELGTAPKAGFHLITVDDHDYVEYPAWNIAPGDMTLNLQLSAY